MNTLTLSLLSHRNHNTVITGEDVRRRRRAKVCDLVRPDRVLQAQPDGGNLRYGGPSTTAVQCDAHYGCRHQRPCRAIAARKRRPVIRQGWLLGGI